MAGIVVKGFKGMRPLLNQKHLDTNESVEAKDVRLFSSAIEPIKDNVQVTPLKISVGSATTIFRAQDTNDEANNWFEFIEDVDVALSPITQDSHKRIYWSGQSSPKMSPTVYAFQSGSNQYPRGSYLLGIPKPTNPPVASGTSVVEITKVQREYAISLTSGTATSESGLSDSVTVNALASAIDTGTLYPSTFSAISSSLYEIDFDVEHDLKVENFIAFSGSTETGWNTKWEVDSIENSKKIKIKNTSAFPSNPPAGTFTLKRRYLPRVTLSNLPDEQRDDGATHKKIYRKVSGTYKLVTTLDIGTDTFKDDLSDTEASSLNSISSTISKRLRRPDSAPLTLIPFNDNSVSKNRSRVVFVKSFTGTGSSTVVTCDGSHKFSVNDTFTISGLSGNKIVTAVNSETIFTFNSTGVSMPTPPFSISNVPIAESSRVYAYTFETEDNVESALSKESAVVDMIDGVTQVDVTMATSFPDGASTKKLYRQDVTHSSDGTYTILDSSFRLVKELPVSQTLYEDDSTTSSIASNSQPSYQDGFNSPQQFFTGVASLPPNVLRESRNYVYTYVSEYGEEGAPSDASTRVDINPFEPVSVSMDTAPIGNHNITKKYVYRTASGTGDTNFQFVAEVPVATTSLIDNKSQAELGELITSTNNEPPPSNLKGLKVMANGIMVGFSGKDICFSEPFLPHAWGSKNFLPVDHDIVALGTFGQSVAVLTESYPYIATGIDPNSMSLQKTSLKQACVSKRSVVETGTEIIYASPDGLVSIGLNGVRVLTTTVLSQEQWQSYNPETIHAYYHEGRYYGFYNGGLLIFNLTGSDALLTLGTQTSSAGRVVPLEDSLYIVESGNIKKMDKANTNKNYSWKSKVFEYPQQTNFAVAQVNSDSYPVTFKLFADGTAKDTVSVSNDDPFRLGAGYLAKDWQFQVEGSADITSVLIAQSLSELGEV